LLDQPLAAAAHLASLSQLSSLQGGPEVGVGVEGEVVTGQHQHICWQVSSSIFVDWEFMW
jgi:hypothetical protein